MTTIERLDALIAKAHREATKEALLMCKRKPTRDHWLAAEKAAWADVPLTTNDCLWLRSKGLEQPGRNASVGVEALDV